jgi:hypothetical protein
VRHMVGLCLVLLVSGCGSDSANDPFAAGGNAGSGGFAGGAGGASGTGGAAFGGASGTGGAAVGGAGGAAGAGAAGTAGAAGGGFQPAYPGQAPPGTLLWGAAVGGNGDPVVRHETPAGHPLAVRRTFFTWEQRTTSLIKIAKDDIAHSRLPWVSVKTPSWAEMGAGDHDAEIDEMLVAIDAIEGPVWLTIHHEPEGGGGNPTPDDPAGPAGHLAMNSQVRARMTALKVDNVALAPILMSWTWDPASGRNPEDWWKDGVYDFVGIDHYRDSEASLLTLTWQKVRTWASQKKVDIAVGEWGMRGTDAAAGLRVHEWYDHAAGSNVDGKGARVVGLSAFDSGLNSPSGSWELKGEQLTAFQALLNDPRTADVVP